MENRVKKIVEVIDSKKGEDIVTFDLRGSGYFTDFVVIATTLGDKHGFALLNYLKDELKPDESFYHIDESDDWTVIDLGDILIHLMSEKYRERFNLESFLDSVQKSRLSR